MEKVFVQSFLDHLNNQHQRIKFTIEFEQNKELPFLDTLMHREEDGSLTTSIYRKKTHTNQYLHYNSNHHARQKIGIVSTLKKRLELISKEEDKIKEEKIIENAFLACGYPEQIVKRKSNKSKEKEKEKDQPSGRVTMPYTKGLSEEIAHKMRKHNIDVVHKPTATIKNILCSKAKDRLDPMDKPGAVYHIKCESHHVDYIGETGRQTKTRMYEHRVITHKDSKRSHSLLEEKVEEEVILGSRRSQRNVQRVDYKALNNGNNQLLTVGDTVVSEHMALNDHAEGDITIKLLDFEPHWKRRKIKETIAINRMKPSLNENEGHYLSPIYDLVPSKYSRADDWTIHRDVTASRLASSSRDDVNLSIENGD